MTESKENTTFTLLGEITWLMSRSPLHREWPIGSINQWAAPALLTKQFRLFKSNGKPVAYVSWAYLSEEVESQYLKNTGNLKPDQWQSGDQLWSIDFIVEPGFVRSVFSDLRNTTFANSIGKSMRWREGSNTLQVYYLHGKNAVPKARERLEKIKQKPAE
jgi:cytolysin-activating lysine-acyltransferase